MFEDRLTACNSAAPHINSCCRGAATRQQTIQSLRRLQQLLVRRQHFCNRLACEVKVEYSGVNN